MLKITIKNKIYLENPTLKTVIDLKRALTIPNPVFQTLMRRVKYGNQSARCLYAVKKEFKYYTYDKTMNTMSIGRGLEDRLFTYLMHPKNKQCYKMNWYLVRKKLSKPIKFNGTLRDYQKGVVDEILKQGKHGVLRLDTAWGKTILAGLLTEKLNTTVLIIVPKIMILDQFVDTFKKFFDYSPGIIQGNKFEIKEITIASISTLIKRDLSKIKHNFGMILVDECHQYITDKRIDTIQLFNPRYLYGLTGTMDRDDGQGEAINFIFGPKLIDKELPTSKPTIYKIKTNSKVEPNIDYADMISELIEDQKRNNIIKDIIESEVKAGRKIICLTKRIAHNKTIESILNNNIKTYSLDSSVKDKDKLFKEFREGREFDVVLGTFSLLATGINLEILSTLVIASDLRSRVLVRQSTGRCLRTMLNKPDVKIYDLVDENNGILLNQWRERRRVYLKNNWEIV